MLINDLNEKPRDFFDVLVVGSGPAGLSFALDLAKNENINIYIVESGARSVTREGQTLNKGMFANKLIDENISYNRARAFGGTTAYWLGESSPLLEDDFVEKDYLPISGWPIASSDIEPYYARAAEFLNVNMFLNKNSIKPDRLDISGTGIEHKLWGYSSPLLRLSESSHFDSVVASKNIYLSLETTVVSLDSDGRNITKALLINKSGTRWVAFRKIVLAAGGIENARCLLNWKESTPKLPFSIENVGKYFAVHPTFFGTDLKLFLYGKNSNSKAYRIDEKRKERFHFTLNSELRREKQWDNLVVVPRVYTQKNEEAEPLKSFFNTFDNGSFYTYNIFCDMRLDPRSRITLHPEKDRYGMKGARVNAFIHPKSVTSWKNGLEYMARMLADSNLVRLKFDPSIFSFDHLNATGVNGAHHHMCATRMSNNISTGVVDKNLKIFKTDNFYILGASVFGTASIVNPTLPLVALSLRLSSYFSDNLFPSTQSIKL